MSIIREKGKENVNVKCGENGLPEYFHNGDYFVVFNFFFIGNKTIKTIYWTNEMYTLQIKTKVFEYSD